MGSHVNSARRATALHWTRQAAICATRRRCRTPPLVSAWNATANSSFPPIGRVVGRARWAWDQPMPSGPTVLPAKATHSQSLVSANRVKLAKLEMA